MGVGSVIAIRVQQTEPSKKHSEVRVITQFSQSWYSSGSIKLYS